MNSKIKNGLIVIKDKAKKTRFLNLQSKIKAPYSKTIYGEIEPNSRIGKHSKSSFKHEQINDLRHFI